MSKPSIPNVRIARNVKVYASPRLMKGTVLSSVTAASSGSGKKGGGVGAPNGISNGVGN